MVACVKSYPLLNLKVFGVSEGKLHSLLTAPISSLQRRVNDHDVE